MSYVIYQVPANLALTVVDRCIQPRQTIGLARLNDLDSWLLEGVSCSGRAISILYQGGDWDGNPRPEKFFLLLGTELAKSENFWRELELPVVKPDEFAPFPGAWFDSPEELEWDIIFDEDWSHWGFDRDDPERERPDTSQLVGYLGVNPARWAALSAALDEEAAELAGNAPDWHRRFLRYRLEVYILQPEGPRRALARAELDTKLAFDGCPKQHGKTFFNFITPQEAGFLGPAEERSEVKPAAKKPAPKKPASRQPIPTRID